MTSGGNLGLFCCTQDLAANVKLERLTENVVLVRYEREKIEKNGYHHQKERSAKPGKKTFCLQVKSRPNRRQNKHKITLNFQKEK